MAPSGGRLPNVIVAGVPKAGTSALARGLAARPDVHLPAGKEIHFFDERRTEGLEWYRAQFTPDEGSVVVMDATPTYVLRDEWFADLRQTLPDARVVVALRNPVDRLWSAYWYLRSMGQEPRSMERAIDEELRGESALPYEHVATGDYRPVLDRLDAHCADGERLVVLHDDLRDDPQGVYQLLCSFLGLDAEVSRHSVDEPVNVTGTLRSFHVRYWTMRLRLFERIPRTALAVDRWNRTTRRPPPMTEPVRRRLLEHYEPSISEVETRLGRSLSSWRA